MGGGAGRGGAVRGKRACLRALRAWRGAGRWGRPALLDGQSGRHRSGAVGQSPGRRAGAGPQNSGGGMTTYKLVADDETTVVLTQTREGKWKAVAITPDEAHAMA